MIHSTRAPTRPATLAIATARLCCRATLATTRFDAAMAVDALRSEATFARGVLVESVIKEAALAPKTLTAEESTTHGRRHSPILRPSLQYGVVSLTDHLVMPLLKAGNG